MIHSASQQDEGYYLCQANNEIGTGLSKVIYITVNGKCYGTFEVNIETLLLFKLYKNATYMSLT